jgi:hypothetical protein
MFDNWGAAQNWGSRKAEGAVFVVMQRSWPSVRRDHRWRRCEGKIVLGLSNALCNSPFEPPAALHGIEIAGVAVQQKTTEHPLGVAVPALSGHAEPTLRGLRICCHVTAAAKIAPSANIAPLWFLAAALSNSAIACSVLRSPPRPFSSISASATWPSVKARKPSTRPGKIRGNTTAFRQHAAINERL